MPCKIWKLRKNGLDYWLLLLQFAQAFALPGFLFVTVILCSICLFYNIHKTYGSKTQPIRVKPRGIGATKVPPSLLLPPLQKQITTVTTKRTRTVIVIIKAVVVAPSLPARLDDVFTRSWFSLYGFPSIVEISYLFKKNLKLSVLYGKLKPSDQWGRLNIKNF